MIGFEFHSSKKWQAARAAFASLFCFTMVLVIILSDARSVEALVSEKQAWLLFLLLFLVFSIVLVKQLMHILMTRFALEFGENSIIDRRKRRSREFAYSMIDIFSPAPEELFNIEPTLAKARSELDMDEYVRVSCRLRSGRAKDDASVTEDFVFFEKVPTPTFEMQQEIISRLRNKITNFELLEQDDGSGFGDDEETNA